MLAAGTIVVLAVLNARRPAPVSSIARHAPGAIPAQRKGLTAVGPDVVGSIPAGEKQKLHVGEVADFAVTASGFDLRYGWTVDGRQAGSGARWTFVPTSDEIGHRRIAVTVQDRQGTVQRAWDVRVEPARAPRVVTVDPPSGIVEAQPGSRVKLRLDAASATGVEQLQTTWTVDGQAVGEGNVLKLRAAATGEMVVRADVRSDLGGATSREWRIAVASPPPAPERAAPAPPPPAVETASARPSAEKATPPPVEESPPPAAAPISPPVETPPALVEVTKVAPPPVEVADTPPPVVRDAAPAPAKATDTPPPPPPPAIVVAMAPPVPPPPPTLAAAVAPPPPAPPPAAVAVAVPPVEPAPAPEPAHAPPVAIAAVPPSAGATGDALAASEVERWLQRYVAAWRTHDVAALRRMGQVTSDAEVEALQQYFDKVQDLEVEVNLLGVSAENGRTTIRFTRRDRFRDPAGRLVLKESPPLEKQVVRTSDGLRIVRPRG